MMSQGSFTRRELLRLAAAAGFAVPLVGTMTSDLAMAAAAKPGGTLRVGVNSDITSLDPNDTVFANNPVYFQVYNYLVKFSTTLRPRPDLAQSWELAKDGMSAVFHLQSNVRTHSGGIFNANALIANFERVKDRTTGGGLFSRLQDWSSAERIDDLGVRFRFVRPRPDFLAQVARWGMIDPAAFANVKAQGGGTGPFKVQEWIPGDHVTFVRFDQYWQAGIPSVDRIVIRPYTDTQSMENAFRAGTIEIAHTLRAKDGERLRASGYNIVQAPVPNEYFVMTLNARRRPFDNLKVRQAFQHAVDRATIVRNALGGVGKPVVQMVAPGALGYDPKLDAEFAFDLDKARAMLRAAGVNEGLKVQFLTLTSDPALPEIAQIIQADLKKIGVDAQVDLQDPASYFPTYFGGKFDLNLTFTTLATLDPTEMTVGSPFRTNPTNPSWLETGPPQGYMDAVSKLTSSFDERERWGYLREAVRYVLGQSWAVPIAVRLPLFGVGKSVRGFAVDPQMIMSLRTAWLES